MLTGRLFEPVAIEDEYPITPEPYHVGSLQHMQRDGDPGTLGAIIIAMNSWTNGISSLSHSHDIEADRIM